MFSKIIYANLIVLLVNQLGFLFYLGKKNRKSDYYFLTVCYACYALAFYLVNGYVGVLFYLMCSANILMQLFKLNRYIISKIVFTIGFMYLYLYAKDYTFYNNIPYLVSLSYMWIKPYVKRKTLMKYIEDILIIIYSYHYQLYALAILEIYRLCFKVIVKYFTKFIRHINSKIE